MIHPTSLTVYVIKVVRFQKKESRGAGAERETQVQPSGPEPETTSDSMTSRKECALLVCKHMTRRHWYSVYGDGYVDLGAEADLPWYRDQVSKRFIIKLGGHLALRNTSNVKCGS